MRRASIALHLAAAVVILAGSGRILAATEDVGDSNGNKPTPTPGSTAETGWNPTNPCTTSSTSLYDLLRCLGGNISPALYCASYPDGSGPSGGPFIPCPYAPGDYTVTYLPPPRYGLQILRNNGTEPDKLYLKEDDGGIQWTTISVNRPNLLCFIGVVTETPSSGFVSISVNDYYPVEVATYGLTPAQVNDALVAGLQDQGWQVLLDPGYIMVSSDLGGAVTKVSFRSTDPAIKKSDLRLMPMPGDDPIQRPPRHGHP